MFVDKENPVTHLKACPAGEPRVLDLETSPVQGARAQRGIYPEAEAPPRVNHERRRAEGLGEKRPQVIAEFPDVPRGDFPGVWCYLGEGDAI